MKILLRFFRGLGKTSPTSGKGCGAFLKSGYPLALLAKLVNGETERFASKGFLKCVHTRPACYYVTVLNGIMSKQGIFKNGDPLALLARLQTIAKIKSRNPLCYFGRRLIYLYNHHFWTHNSRVAKIIAGNYNEIDKQEFVGACNEPNRINSQERYFTNI